MSTAQPQRSSSSSNRLWQQRKAPFVPPTRMSAAPVHQFNSPAPAQQPQEPPPPPPSSTDFGPRNTNRASSFFSFGRNRSSISGSQQNIHKAANGVQYQQSAPPYQPPVQNGQSMAIAPEKDQKDISTDNGYAQKPLPPQAAPNSSDASATQSTPSSGSSVPVQQQPPPLHPELRSFVSLSFAHVHKIYFSGRLVRKVERLTDGSRPKDSDWSDVWGQLGGTTLSVWDMKEIEDANKEGREVPPSYINVTDAFVSVLGSVSAPPQGNAPPRKYTNVLTLNTAGHNLLLFACPDGPSLVSWAASLRLASWEKSRLEEIYSAHLLRMTLSDGGAWKEPRTTLVKGQMEGWAQIRVAGHLTDWKRAFMVLHAATPHNGSTPSVDGPLPGGAPPSLSKRRLSSMFAGGASAPVTRTSLSFYASPKARDRRKPMLAFTDITQAFAVYPERPEMISKSTLIKAEGTLSEEDPSGRMTSRDAWILFMPEIEGPAGRLGVMEMLKWIVGLHDAFELYGRPKGYTWDPRDPVSMMFAYPFGPLKDHLFLDRELAEVLDPRDDRTSSIRSRLLNILMDRMHGPPVDLAQQIDQIRHSGVPPPINVNGPRGQSLLTPITERSSIPTRENTIDGHFDQYGSPVLSVLDHDVPRNIASMISTGSPVLKPASPGIPPGALTNGNGGPIGSPQQPQINGSALGVVNISVPADPIPATKASASFLPALPAIPGSAVNTPPILSPASTNEQPKSLTPAPPLSDGRRPSSDSLRSPQSGTRNVANQQSPTRASIESTGYSHALVTPEIPRGRSSSPGAQRPSSLRDVPRAPSPLRTSSTGPPPPGQAQPPRIMSPLAQSSTSPSPPMTPPGAFPTLRGQPPTSSGYTPLPPIPLSNRHFDSDQMSGQLSPKSSHYSYPAQAEVQNPDIYEPMPQKSRVSDHVLDAPFLSDSGDRLSNEHGSPYAVRKQLQQQQQQQAQQQQEQQQRSPQTRQQQPPPPLPVRAQRMPPIAPPPPPPVPQTQPYDVPSTSPPPSTEHGDGLPRQQTPMSFMNNVGSIKSPVTGVRPSHVHIQRKPSGARAPPAKKVLSTTANVDLQSVQEHSDHDTPLQHDDQPLPIQPVKSEMDDYSADALRALSLADAPEEGSRSAQDYARGSVNRQGSPAYQSSFGTNKAAADRKAKVQAQQAAAAAMAMQPGRPNEKKKNKGRGAWDNGSSEEEDDEEDDDDDADSDGPTPPRHRQPQPPQQQTHQNNHHPGVPSSSTYQSMYESRNTPPASNRGTPPIGRRPPSPDRQRVGSAGRVLPHVPTSRSPANSRDSQANSNMMYNDRPRTQYDQPSPPPSGPPRAPDGRNREAPPQLKQNLWSSALNPDFNKNQPGSGREPFVKVEDDADTMTKVFAPQGLLQAGLQDKHDRSAKRQEELARESGTSLINVPGKPLDPQTGLLGAVTAHERDKKREGGVGAVLTQKLADERKAEERQRKIDELQRQQLDQMSNNGAMDGGMYGGAGPMGQMGFQNPQMLTPGGGSGFGFNPYMMNPMMSAWGMMPGMGMGMPGMNPMGGMPMNQQAMFQAQMAAAEAYQRAMASFSQAGSHAGSVAPSEAGDGASRPNSRFGAASPVPSANGSQFVGMPGMGMNPMFMNPMMTPGAMGMGMGGYGPWGGPATPNSMASPGMYPQQMSATASPSASDRHAKLASSPFFTSPDQFNPGDRSASQSRQSNAADPAQN